MTDRGIGLRLVDSHDDACDLMRWLGDVRGPLAFDTETTGLRWWTDEIRLGVLGDERTGWAVPFDLWGGVFLDALRRWRGELVGHNSEYDVHMVREAGLRLDRSRVHNTQAAAHLVDPLVTGLKPVAERELGSWAGDWERRKDEVFRVNGWDWRSVPLRHPAYWRYGASDAVLTARIHPVLQQRIAGQQDLYELELASGAIIGDMEARGVRVDLGYASEKAAELRAYAGDLRRRLADEWGLSDPGSNKQLIAALEGNDAIGPDYPRTKKTGQLKVDARTLRTVDHPMVATLLEMRRAEKWAKAYFESFVSFADGDLLHPSFKPLGARTGRMSCSDPPMQQIPRGELVRRCFLAREGRRLLLADMDQIEIRLMAHFCGSPTLLRAIREGVDLHVLVASMALQVPMEAVDALTRQIFKSASYSKAYGAGSKKFAETAGVSAAAGAEFYERYDEAVPEVQRFQQQVQRVARRRHRLEGRPYVTTPSGRQLPCDPGSEYALVNYLIQGTAGDVFKKGLVRLDRAGWTDYLVLLVHDEYVLDVPDDLIDEARVEVPRIVQDTDTFSVPLTAGCDTYDCWADKYAGEKSGWTGYAAPPDDETALPVAPPEDDVWAAETR